MGTANIATPSNVVANIPNSKPHDGMSSAVLAFFETGNTKDAARACGQTEPTLKRNLTEAFAGSPFGKGFGITTGVYPKKV